MRVSKRISMYEYYFYCEVLATELFAEYEGRILHFFER